LPATCIPFKAIQGVIFISLPYSIIAITPLPFHVFLDHPADQLLPGCWVINLIESSGRQLVSSRQALMLFQRYYPAVGIVILLSLLLAYLLF
jgi:hypothetical protein